MLIRTSRRRFLSGLSLGAGAMLLGPMADRLIREANGEVLNDKKVIFYTVREGTFTENLPFMEGDAMNLNAYEPLAPYRDKVTWILNTYNPFNRDLHGNKWPLSIVPGIGEDGIDGPGGMSFDWMLGHALAGGKPIPAITAAPYGGNNSGVNKFSTSAEGPGVRPHLFRNADELFEYLFGAITGDNADELKARVEQDTSLLDFVGGEINAVSSRLANPEREKMEQYLDSVRSIETQLKGLAELSCGDQTPPEDPSSVGGNEKRDAMFDIVVQAMACGILPVARMEWKSDGGSHKWWHGEGTDADFRSYHALHAQSMLELWERLLAIPGPSGTMADDTLIVCCGKGRHHHGGQFEHQAMLMGDLGGVLKTGRVVDLPQAPEEPNDPRIETFGPAKHDDETFATRCISDLFVSIAHAVGAPIDTVGDPKHNRGPIEELFA